jgi:hypothetical protein
MKCKLKLYLKTIKTNYKRVNIISIKQKENHYQINVGWQYNCSENKEIVKPKKRGSKQYIEIKLNFLIGLSQYNQS